MQTFKIKYFIPSILIAVAIAYGSLTTGNNETVKKFFNFDIPDKLIHAFFYFLLSLSLIYPVLIKNYRVHFNTLVLFFMIFLYGILMEIIQYFFIEGRSGEFYDVLANTGGILLAFLIMWIYKTKFISVSFRN
jgi:VanZ family protein